MVSSKDHEEALSRMAENQQRGIGFIDELVQAKETLAKVRGFRDRMNITINLLDKSSNATDREFASLIKIMRENLDEVLGDD